MTALRTIYTQSISAISDGSDEHSFEVVTDPDRSFTLFSFKDGGSIVTVQPADSELGSLLYTILHYPV